MDAEALNMVFPPAGTVQTPLIEAPLPAEGEEADEEYTDPFASTADVRDRVVQLHALRRGMRRGVADVTTYRPIVSLRDSDIPKGHDLRVRYSGINLLHGEHLHIKAKTWRDVNSKGRKLLTSYLNALANATGSKKFSMHKPGTKAAAADGNKDGMPHARLLFFVETLWAPRSSVAGQTSRMPTGYRLQGALYVEGKRLLDEMNAARKKKKIPEFKSVDEAYNAWYPLARGFMRSFDEAKQLQLKIEALRNKAAAAGRGKPTSITAAANAALSEEEVMQKPTPLALDPTCQRIESLMAYEWLQYTNPIEFHYDVLSKYVRPQNYVVSDKEKLAPGRIFDPRPYVDMDGSHDDDARQKSYDHPDNPINIDQILSKESLMSFFAYNGRDQPIIDPLQTQLELYARANDDPEDPVDEPVAEEPAEEEEEEEEPAADPMIVDTPQNQESELLDSDDEALEGMAKNRADEENEPMSELVESDDEGEAEVPLPVAVPLRRRVDADVEAPPHHQPYQERLEHNLQLHLGDIVFPDFPYPGSTYLINSAFVFPETFALLSLPHEMGTPVTELRIQEGWPAPDDPLQKKQAAAVITLKHIEEIRRNIELTTVEKDRRDFIYQALERTNEYRNAVTTEFDRLAKSITHERVIAVINEQRNIVASAIGREGDRIRSGSYDAILVDSREKPSTDEYMAITDFLPDDNFENGSNSKGSDRASRLKSQIANQLREGYRSHSRYANGEAVTNDILHGNLDSIDVPTEELLARMEERQQMDKEFEQVADELWEHVAKYVDTVDADFEKRDDILAFRTRAQTTFGLAAHKTKLALDEMQKLKSTNAQKMDFAKEFISEVWKTRVQLAEELIDKLKNSNNIPESLMRDFRTFFKKTCTPKGMEAVYADKQQDDFDHKPFVAFLQYMFDDFCAVFKASPNSFRALQAALFGGLDAHTFGIDRSEPAFNPVFVGDTGIGKSWLMRLVALLASPGTCRHMSNATPNTFNTETSYDNVLMIFEEMKSRWLYMSDDVKDKGASEELNFLKDRLTRFFTSTDSWFRDEATGRRSVVKSRSSHQNATMGGSNQNLTNMDKNVARRFVIWFVPEQLNNDGASPDQLKAFEEFENSETGRTAAKRHQMVHALYVVVRNLMKGGVIPNPATNSVRFYLRCILDELRDKGVDVGGSTKFHHVIQLTENLQLYYACWMALFSPLATKFYKEEGNPEAWSAEAILKLVTPFITPTKDALAYALTLVDFLYCPSYVEHMLKDLARDGLHYDKPDMWSFRTSPGRERKDPLNYDVQYFAFHGRTVTEIYERIAGFNKDFKLRSDEVGLLIDGLKRKFVTCPEFIGINPDNTSKRPAYIERNPNKSVTLPVIGIEEDHTGGSGKRWRLYILIHFLEQRTGLRFDDPALSKKLHASDPDYDAKTFRRANAEQLTRIVPGYSILTDAIMKVFAHPVLEKIPNEGRIGRPKLFEYATSYIPRTITIKDNHPTEKDEKGQPRVIYKRVSFHGVPMMIHVSRDPKARPLVQLNHVVLMPTSRNHLKRLRDPLNVAGNARAEHLGETTGMVMGTSDMDYSQNSEYMRQLCHPGIDLVFRYLKLPQDVHGLAAYRMPLGCNAISYRVAREIALADGVTKSPDYVKNYPADNLYKRVQDHISMMRGVYDPKSASHTDVNDMMGMGTFANLTFVSSLDSNTGKPIPITGIPEWDAINKIKLDFRDDIPDEDAMNIDEPSEETTPRRRRRFVDV